MSHNFFWFVVTKNLPWEHLACVWSCLVICSLMSVNTTILKTNLISVQINHWVTTVIFLQPQACSLPWPSTAAASPQLPNRCIDKSLLAGNNQLFVTGDTPYQAWCGMVRRLASNHLSNRKCFHIVNMPPRAAGGWRNYSGDPGFPIHKFLRQT